MVHGVIPDPHIVGCIIPFHMMKHWNLPITAETPQFPTDSSLRFRMRVRCVLMTQQDSCAFSRDIRRCEDCHYVFFPEGTPLLRIGSNAGLIGPPYVGVADTLLGASATSLWSSPSAPRTSFSNPSRSS
jgi:hypothetical protein